MSKPLRVVGYVRVSTDKQDLSPEAQESRLFAYAKAFPNIELVSVHQETKSAQAVASRPVLSGLLSRLKTKEFDGLLVAKLDRLTRSLRDLADLIEGVFAPGAATLISVAEHVDTATPSGRLILNILTTVAQWEREAISDRTKAVFALKRGREEKTGNCPIGWTTKKRADPDGKEVSVLVPDVDELETIRLVHFLREQGLSLRAVAEELEEQGRLTRGGKRYGPMQIRRMLKVEAPS